jgi:polyhydroxyalkanoate synthesis regulator phasin
MDRLIAPIKVKDSAVALGKIEGTLAEQGRTVLAVMSEGRITPDEANTLMQVVVAQARIVEVDELERRVSALEVQVPAK